MHAKNIRLRIHQPDAATHCFGHTGPLVDWHLSNAANLRAILKHPETKLGSTYVRGDWDIDTLQLPWLLQALLPPTASRPAWFAWHRGAGPGSHASSDNYPRWKDSDASVAAACLGQELTCRCACFNEPGITLEEAQRVRQRKLLEQLQLQPGQHVLDADAGWGSQAVSLAAQADIRVTAMVTTPEQIRFGQQLAQRHGVHMQVQFRLGDIENCAGSYDRVLATAFPEQPTQITTTLMTGRLENLLRDNGFALLQIITGSSRRGLSNRWLQGQLPRPRRLPLLSGVTTALESTRLSALRLEDLSIHWQTSLEHWLQRYRHHRDLIRQQFGAWFTRYWEFMLASQLVAARAGQLHCFEIVLGKTGCNSTSLRAPRGSQFSTLTPDLERAITALTRDR